MSNTLLKFLPFNLRLKIRQKLVSILGETVSDGWENYAKNFEGKPGKFLGDEWNEPELIGFDGAPNAIVPTLDRKVFQPYLGKCQVILEIGPGGGRFTKVLFPKCQRVIAADTSPTMLSLLQSRYETETSLKCVQLDGQGLGPIEDKSIDAAFSFDVFVHLELWDIFNYLCELKRVLKPGGKAIIHHGNSLSRLGWRRFVAETRQQLNTPKIWGTFSFMSPNVFKELSERAGLHHINCITDIVRRDGISLLQSPAS
jgi:SAM-dependent methyltransferase